MALIEKLRPASIETKSRNVNTFPFDAFEFDDPNRTQFPSLMMKYPWNFKIGNESMPWTAEKHGIIPSNGWFTELLKYNDTELSSESSTSTISETTNNLRNSAYGVNGSVEYNLSSLPGYSGNYTIVLRFQNKWIYKTSGGIDNAHGNIEVSGTTLKIHSGFTFTLPLTLSYTSQSFRELLIIPESYSQSAIEQILNGADTFIEYFSASGENPSLTLSAQGLLWKSGDKYIRLGDTASFHGVDLDSGNFVEGSEGWQITADGDVEFNNGTFRGELDAAGGSFSGELDAASGTFSGNLDAAGGIFSGELNAASGSFTGELQAVTGSFSGDITAGTGHFQQLQFKDLIIGNNVLKSYLPKVTSNNSVQRKVVLQILASGTIKLYFQGKGGDGTGVPSVIYVKKDSGGTVTLIDSFVPPLSYTAYTYEISIIEGDVIEVWTSYAAVGSSYAVSSVRNCKILTGYTPGFLSWLGARGVVTTSTSVSPVR